MASGNPECGKVIALEFSLQSSDLLLHMLISVSTGSFDISSDVGTTTAQLSMNRADDLNSTLVSTTAQSGYSTERNETTLSAGKGITTF